MFDPGKSLIFALIVAILALSARSSLLGALALANTLSLLRTFLISSFSLSVSETTPASRVTFSVSEERDLDFHPGLPCRLSEDSSSVGMLATSLSADQCYFFSPSVAEEKVKVNARNASMDGLNGDAPSAWRAGRVARCL
jgi:hypothetical protein